MHRLKFGTRARRRARLKQAALTIWLISIVTTLVGVPGSVNGLELVQRLAGRRVALADAAGGLDSSESAASTLRFRRRVFEHRATPTPTPEIAGQSATATAEEPIEEVVHRAAEEFGLDGDYLLSVAMCESTLDPGAVNPAGYHGLFQFDQSTWASYGYGSIYDPVAQARTAARLLAAGQTSRWPNCA